MLLDAENVFPGKVVLSCTQISERIATKGQMRIRIHRRGQSKRIGTELAIETVGTADVIYGVPTRCGKESRVAQAEELPICAAIVRSQHSGHVEYSGLEQCHVPNAEQLINDVHALGFRYHRVGDEIRNVHKFAPKNG